jgi:ferric-dicitrate binding protein FerR (iron transport regulator)
MRLHLKLGLKLLICVGALGCAWAAFDEDTRAMLHRLLRTAGIEAQRHSGPPAREFLVAAGNELSVAGTKVTITRVPPDIIARRLAWAGIYQKNGWLAFQGETLEAVVAEFNRHNKRQLRIGDPSTARLRIGGKFRVTDVDGFVAALGITHDVKATGPRADGAGAGPDVITLSGGRSSGPAEGDEEIDEAPAGSAGSAKIPGQTLGK